MIDADLRCAVMSGDCKTGVLLLNLGSPEAPTPRAIRRYLREFLGDPRVLDMPAIARKLLLELVILPTRPKRAAEAYSAIWTDEGSPLILHSRELADLVARKLGDSFELRLVMRYGKPSIAEGLAAICAAGAERVVVVPLFPQYAEATTGSALAAIDAAAAKLSKRPEITSVGAFYADTAAAHAWAEVGAQQLRNFGADHTLFSYHGLPAHQVKKADTRGNECLSRPDCCEDASAAPAGCYRAQCYATTRALAQSFELEAGSYSSSFQSRLGRTEWIRPYTDEVLPQLRERGVERLAILCPAFVADCLETLEEIGIRAREQWRELGGTAFELLPCPNAHPSFADAVAGWVRNAALQAEATASK